MKITIVLSGFYRPPSLISQVDRLRNAIDKYGESEVVDTADILAYIDNDDARQWAINNELQIRDKCIGTTINNQLDTDAVIYLDKDIHIAAMLEKHGLKLFNSAYSIAVTDDKMATHIALVDSGIRMPVTVSAPLMYRGDDDGRFVSKLLSIIQFPIIIKECHGSFGSQVYYAECIEELTELRTKLINIPHVYQEFVSSSFGRDVRLIVVGGNVIAAMERRNTKNFKSNIEQGGEGYALNIKDLDERFIQTAVKATRILGLDYAGIDLLYGTDGEPILCEVNSNAYFNKISEVTGVDIPEIYVNHIMETLQIKN